MKYPVLFIPLIIMQIILFSNVYTQESEASLPRIMENGVSVPGDFPFVEVTVNDNPDSGWVFLSNYSGTPYMMMLENSGAPYFYKKMKSNVRDFKVQPNGLITYYEGGFKEMDSSYTAGKKYKAARGWGTDNHELQVLKDGHYFLIAYKDTIVDMSQIVEGGKEDAKIHMTALQEFDENDNCILHFSAWDHYHPKDMIGYSYDDKPTNSYFRLTHMNAVDVDDDGHLVLSNKRVSEITKINRQTGEVIWRLGGANNQFTFVDDPLNGFYTQHDIRALGNGHYTLFDNGNLHDPPVSRAVEYKLDTLNMTATMVWEYRDGSFGFHMGNAQRLPNGNTFINWAVQDLPKAMEVTPDGDKVYELNFIESIKSYRTFRCRWDVPTTKPYLIAESHPSGVALIFNQFGDKNIDYYRIYGGPSHSPTTLMDTSARTLKWLTNLENDIDYSFRVTSIDKEGNESDYSNEESVYVRLVLPGINQLLNGDFSNGKDHWDFSLENSADAVFNVQDGVCEILVDDPGNKLENIQLSQGDLVVVQNREYEFSFDIQASDEVYIYAKVTDESGKLNYSFTDFIQATPRQEHHVYPFTMLNPSDFNAKVVFRCGNINADILLDNIRLEEITESDVSGNTPQLNNESVLDRIYPNPFNHETNIQFQLEETGSVQISLYNVQGQKVRDLGSNVYNEGFHTVHINARDLCSGIYMVQIYVKIHNSKKNLQTFRKLILLK